LKPASITGLQRLCACENGVKSEISLDTGSEETFKLETPTPVKTPAAINATAIQQCTQIPDQDPNENGRILLTSASSEISDL